MRSGLYVCVEDVKEYLKLGDNKYKEFVIWNKGTVVAWALVLDLPPDPKYWKPLCIDTGSSFADVRETK